MMFFAELMDCCTMRLEHHVVVMQLRQTLVSGGCVGSPKYTQHTQQDINFSTGIEQKA